MKGESLRTSLSYLMGRPSAVKGLAIFAALSFPVPVARRIFCGAHGHVRGIGLPVVKGLAILAALSLPVPVAARFFAKHLAMCGAEGGSVVRARGAHCKTASHLAMCEALAFRWLCRLRFHALPKAGRLRHGPAAKGKAIASPFAERAAVLQGAPRARPNGR